MATVSAESSFQIVNRNIFGVRPIFQAATEHGFCFPERPQYVKEAAEKVWERIFDLFERNLG